MQCLYQIIWLSESSFPFESKSMIAGLDAIPLTMSKGKENAYFLDTLLLNKQVFLPITETKLHII